MLALVAAVVALVIAAVALAPALVAQGLAVPVKVEVSPVVEVAVVGQAVAKLLALSGVPLANRPRAASRNGTSVKSLKRGRHRH